MFRLRDFLHIPQLDPLFKELIKSQSGLVIISGVDPHPLPSLNQDIFLPSGRSTMFDIVFQEILAAQPAIKVQVVTAEKSVSRIPRQFKRRTTVVPVETPEEYPEKIFDAIRKQPELLVIDRLNPENINAAFEAANRGLLILTQLDTIFCGAEAIRHLRDIGAADDRVELVKWILSAHRFSRLCSHCKKAATPSEEQVRLIENRFPKQTLRRNPAFQESTDGTVSFFDEEAQLTIYKAPGCEHCSFTGRFGEVTAFDVFGYEKEYDSHWDLPSKLPLEEYILNLVLLGYLPIEDCLRFEKDLLQRTYKLFIANEQALEETNANLRRRLVELEASNRVLEQRTEALISLQDIVQLLNVSERLEELANRICQKASSLCGADRTILYYWRGDQVEILALRGWELAVQEKILESGQVFSPNIRTEPTSYLQLPPGLSVRVFFDEQVTLKAGLRIPLVVQDELVGLMIVQSTRKDFFTPGEKALLKTFAHHASVAIQRAGLIEDLRAKIDQLEAAQTELIKKERLEHELTLARQVQQSMLPTSFPQIHGFQFAARNEPARQVGGDFYDVIDLDPEHFGIFIGDVSDKGMPAALFMALTRSLVIAEARKELSPRKVLMNINQLLMEFREPRQFVSVFFGVVEKTSKRLTYARAGHEYPIWLHDSDIHPLTGEGTILGVLENDQLSFTEEQALLSKGDRIVFYTDGLTDAMDPKGISFDLSNLEGSIRSLAGGSADEICNAVFQKVLTHQHGTDQFDDMTILVVEID